MQYRPAPGLPKPDHESAEHSVRVTEYIRRQIEAGGGQISFAEYMQHALYAPGLGYYAAGSTKFGEAGDFVTAPESSTLFGRVLARQCRAVLTEGATPDILEFGAGSGRLAADILAELAALDALPERYRILEVSPDLQQRQRALLEREIPELAERVEWLAGLPDAHAGVVIANEVLDALPVERFVRRSAGVKQVCVGWDGDRFSLNERPAPPGLADAVAVIESDIDRPLPNGYASDICLAAPHWIADLAAILTEGIVFVFDYGVSRREYYGAERSGGWLRCHFRHHAHNDPLVLTGIQDITAWVDFTAVAAAAQDNALDIAGYTNQAQFLIGGGLDAILAGMTELPIAAQLELSGEVKLLTLPGEMGENFKCLALSRGAIAVPGAFLAADKTASL